VALVVTPEGSILVASTGDDGIDTARVPGVAWVRADGTLASLRAVVETVPARAGRKESSFASLRIAEDGREREVRGSKEARDDLDAAMKADPDMATVVYHRDRYELLGMHGPLVTWAYRSEEYLGGAHPGAIGTIVMVDLDRGEVVPPDDLYEGRDLARETDDPTKGVKECTRRPVGVARIEGRGGLLNWVAALSHEFELCAGSLRLATVRSPVKAPAASPVVGTLIQSGDLMLPWWDVPMRGVADWRADADSRLVVALMALDRGDSVPAPWEKGFPDTRSREIRVMGDMTRGPVVIGRATRIVAIQFLAGRGRAARLLESVKM
jgi:hypothetical protein